MAAPARTPTQLATLIHNSTVGQSQAGWTLTDKVLESSSGLRQVWRAVVTRQGSSWTGWYTTQDNGQIGRVIKVIDGAGRWWYSNDTSWRDGGVG